MVSGEAADARAVGVIIRFQGYGNDHVRVLAETAFQINGFVEIKGNGVIAGSFSSFKYPTRAPEGTTLLRVFVGGARAPEMVELPRDELVGRVENEVCKLLGVKGDPLMVDVARFPNSMPQYYLGRLEWRQKLQEALDSEPTLALAGNALNGVGLPVCVKSGYDAADKILADLGLRPQS